MERPRVVFVNWGSRPEDDPTPKFPGQSGFYLQNDGGPAYAITLQGLSVASGRTVAGNTLNRIGPGESGFMFVYLQGYGAIPNPTKWDLPTAMMTSEDTGLTDGPDPSVAVSIQYQDGENRHYRSTATLTMIRSQRRLAFGPTTFELIAADTAVNGSDHAQMSPRDELRGLGLTISLDEDAATKIWVALSRIDANVREKLPEYPAEPVKAAYDAIAQHIVSAESPDQVLEEMIPQAIFSFHSVRRWSQFGNLERLSGVLNPCVIRWKSNRLEMQSAKSGTQETELPRYLNRPDEDALRQQANLETAARRQAIVMPILQEKGWTRGRWATEAGVGSNSVYEYLDGKRRLSPENRKAMAEALGLEPGHLPE